GMAFAPALDAVRIAWPDVPHLAYLGTQPDVEAVLDDRFRALLGGSDDRAERILDYPPGHFARARERARAKLNEYMTRTQARRNSRCPIPAQPLVGLSPSPVRGCAGPMIASVSRLEAVSIRKSAQRPRVNWAEVP